MVSGASELEQVEELRELVKSLLTPYYDTHFNLLRWIQGHPNLSIKEVSKKLTHHLLFRKCMWDMDTYHKKKRGFHPIHKHWTRGITGKSGVLENVIVNIEQAGKVDYEGMLAKYSINDVMKARLFDLEEFLSEVMKLEKETGKQASILYVMDAEGVEYTKKLVDLILISLRSISEFMADHYVELVKYFVIVNIPPWAYAVWMMMKPLLPERSRQKIKTIVISRSFNSIILFHVRMLSASNWRREILDLASPEACPSFWNDENNNGFGATIDRPFKVPRIEVEMPDKLDKMHLKAGSVHWIDYDLKQGDTLKWWMMSSGNFGFSILIGDGNEENDVYLTPQLYPLFPWMPGPTDAPFEDTIVIPEDGHYKLWISNARAWWSTLTLNYRISVIPRK